MRGQNVWLVIYTRYYEFSRVEKAFDSEQKAKDYIKARGVNDDSEIHSYECIEIN